MGVIAKRPIANVAWRHARKPDAYYEDYWMRLKKLDYPFLREPLEAAVASSLRFTLSLPGVHTAIVGTTKPEHWQQDAALLAAGPLPAREADAIRGRWAEVAEASWVGQGVRGPVSDLAAPGIWRRCDCHPASRIGNRAPTRVRSCPRLFQNTQLAARSRCALLADDPSA